MSDKPSNTTWKALDKRDADAHHKPYFDWLRHVVTISLATLTALISLQGQYIPRSPRHIWTIQIAWVALALCILFGLFALRWEYQMHLEKIANRRKLVRELGEEKAAIELRKGIRTDPPKTHRMAAILMLLLLAVALAMLCVFGSANIGL